MISNLNLGADLLLNLRFCLSDDSIPVFECLLKDAGDFYAVKKFFLKRPLTPMHCVFSFPFFKPPSMEKRKKAQRVTCR